MNTKPQDLQLVEECFFDIQNKKNVNASIKKIERVLSRFFGIKFTINISNNTTHEFFGMNIYPSISTMDTIIDSIVADKSSSETIAKLWQKNDEWFLEIDSILLYDKSLNANPSEITAILLHEIGHIVYSNTVPSRLNKILRYKMIELDHITKKMVTTDKIRKLFNLSIIEACSSKSFSYVNVNKERLADKFAVKYGYGEDLDNFITKLIASRGNSLINRTDEELDNDVKSIVNWTIQNTEELEFRKKKLRVELKTTMLKTPSDFVKKNVDYIYKSFFGDVSDKYRELLSESYVSNPRDTLAEIKEDQYLESFRKRIITEAISDLFDSYGKVKKISQTDIDILYVELDKIETNDDKIYALDRVSEKLDIVNTGLDYIATGREKKVSQSASTLNSYKKQLEELRERILKTKIVEKSYGVFIKYPRGYEG